LNTPRHIPKTALVLSWLHERTKEGEMGNESDDRKKCRCGRGPMGGNGAIYGLGMIGALFYFIHQATSFWGGVAGVVKAVFWPAIVLYKVLGLLNM
jgi:hypothetical protein